MNRKKRVLMTERQYRDFKRFLQEKEAIVVDRIDKDNYKEYIGKTVKVTGNVILRGLGLTKIPINFTEVGRDFNCSYNKLTSLKGAPKYVGGSFYCRSNELTTLVGAPEEVGDSFYCSNNKLTSLEGAPEEVGSNFYCSYNNLTSLEGAPKEVGSDFYCSDNPLKSTKGKPAFIGGEFIY